MQASWLPNPPDGTSVAGGFDGSWNDDHTVIKLETREGFLFTPRYGPDRRPTIWNPKEWGGQIPRAEINAAWGELSRRYRLLRIYCDPGFRDERDWSSDIDRWDQEHGPDVFASWVMSGSGRRSAVFSAIRRFESDVEHLITHDGCPITTTHIANARKIALPDDRYLLGKPEQHQKIDAAITSILAHEAASDMRAVGWPADETEHFVFGL